ncbi:MAG: GTP 3',8-cyclase MoaA [Candidatus Heimdallarchaeaceae archaeon]|nr:MAG: GTP 3',8-cyclase MoaA [Candidatus Pacearchaeota archaeon]
MINIKLIDKYNREITRLRVSVISSCNLNCPYCHNEGFSSHNSNKLTLDQIKKLLSIIDKYSISSVKITGGEPLLHPQIVDIVKIFSSHHKIRDLSMTTNGLLLEKYAHKLKNAGLNRVNISCDSYHYNPSYKSLKSIAKQITIAQEVGLTPIKLNMVLLKGINENEIEPMINFTAEKGITLQIIELIDLDKEYFNKFHVSLENLASKLENEAVEIRIRELHQRKQYTLSNGAKVEIVNPVHNTNFCMNCKTLRVTNDFQFQPCLYRIDNLVPIGEDIDKSLKEAIERRRPFFVKGKNIHD